MTTCGHASTASTQSVYFAGPKASRRRGTCCRLTQAIALPVTPDDRPQELRPQMVAGLQRLRTMRPVRYQPYCIITKPLVLVSDFTPAKGTNCVGAML